MKKLFLSMSLMFAALTLTNCTNEIVDDVKLSTGKGFSFEANVDSRALLNGKSVAWETTDQIGFGGTKASSTYTSVRVYPYDYVSGNTFANATSVFEEANTFYAIYPYTAKKNAEYGEINTELATSNALETVQYYNVGKSGLVQNGETAHHIMAVAPMYWLSDGAVEPSALNVQLHHAASVMDFVVTNGTDEEVTLKSFTFSVPETVKICGTYYINVSTGELRSSGDSYVYSSQIVNLANAPKLAKGASMHVYMAVAPFALAAGDEVEIAILNTNEASYTLKKAVSKAVSFEKGKINTQAITVDSWKAATGPMTVAELVAAINAGERSFAGQSVQGIVSSFSGDGANLSYGTITLTDNNGQKGSAVKLYDTANGTLIKGTDLFVGDEVVISLANATYATYKGGDQLKGILIDDVIEVVSYDNALVAAELTIAAFKAEPKAWDNVLVKFVGVRPEATSVGKTATTELTFTDGTEVLNVYNRSAWTAGKDIVIEDFTGTLYGIAQMNGDNVGQVVPTEAAHYNDFLSPITLEKSTVSVPAAGGTENVAVTVRSGYALGTVTADAAWASVAKGSDNTLTITVAANTGDAREATISVPVTKNGATVVTKTITVKQSGAGAAEEETVEVKFASLSYANQADVTTVTAGDVTLTFGKGSNSNAPKYYNAGTAVRVYPNNTITATGATVKSIKVYFSQNDTSKGVCSLTANSGSFDITDWENSTEAVWAGSTDNLALTVASTKNGALRITQIDVTYEK